MKLYTLLEKLTEFVNIVIIRYQFTKLTLYDGVKHDIEKEIFDLVEDEMYNILHRNVIKMRIENEKLVILID